MLTLDVTGDISWSSPLEPGADTVSFDLLRVAGAPDFMAATCVESDESDLVAFDAATPPAGELWSYLVRSENACGSTLGTASIGTQRPGVSCP